MQKKIFAIVVLLTLAFSVVPANSWIYPDCTEDAKSETFGPRCDNLLIKMYPDLYAECNALSLGEIDVMDWPIPRDIAEKWNQPPYDYYIKKVYYGSDLDEIVLEINNNPNEYLGNPPDPTYPNPVYPNPCSVSSFRHALAHLIDRDYIVSVIDQGYGFPMYTEVPPFLAMWQHPEIVPGGLLEDLTHPYNPDEAKRLLDADGFPINPATGWRFWDRNNNGEEDLDEYLSLRFLIRYDDPKKWAIGEWIAEQIQLVNVRVNLFFSSRESCLIQVVYNKNFHLFIGDRNLRKDPDFLYELKHTQMYWHPGPCPNYIAFNDPEYDLWAEQLKYAKTQAEALAAAYQCQEVYATPCKIGSIPIEVRFGVKAMRRCYSGGTGGSSAGDEEDVYRCQSWKGFVNGYWAKCSCGGALGINNWWTFLNAYPEGHLMGDCKHMTIRYGFMVPSLLSLNPIYAFDYWEWEVLNKIYDTLLKEDPYTLEDIPWIAKDWAIGTWFDQYGVTKTKIRITLNPCVKWQDGTPFSAADVRFTLVELPEKLEERGLPPPWWHQKVKYVHSVSILDPCNIEILLDVQSIWALHWIGELKILPKHIWKPIVDEGDPTGFAPDPNLIGCGPWRLDEYVEYSHILLVANKPCGVVDTGLPGSESIHSPYGYFGWCPVHLNIHTLNEYYYRGELPGPSPSNPVCSRWLQIKGKHKHINQTWHLSEWRDNNENLILDQDDEVLFKDINAILPEKWEKVFEVEVDPELDLIRIWTDWFSQKIYPHDGAAFGIELHNQWLNPIPNTAWPNHEQVGELWVDKIVKLSVEQIIPDKSGTIFPPSQYLHFQEDTEVHVQENATIHFLTTGTIVVDGATMHVSASEMHGFPPCTQILFPPCMEIHLPDGASFHWKHPTEVQIKPTESLILKACEPHKEIINLKFKKCHYDIKVMVHVKGPPEIPVTKDDTITLVPNPWVCQRINCTYDFWATIKEDIVGKWYDTWHDPPQIYAPDCKVDIKDLAVAAKAFGSYPCHPRWNCVADMNDDYKVDIKDLARIAKQFGWLC